MPIRTFLAAAAATLCALSGCQKQPTPPANEQSANPNDNNQPDALATNRPDAQNIDTNDLILYGLRQAPPTSPGCIRIATYNVENLFDDHDDPNLSGDLEDIDDTKPASELKAVADAIHAVDPDIIALDEIESEAALHQFVDNFLSDMAYQFIISKDAGDERGIEQAVLSRFPITETRQWVGAELGGTHPDLYGSEPNWHAGEPIKFHRSPLLVTVQIPPATDSGTPYDLTLIAVHHKSGRYSDYWRDREAAGVTEIVQALNHAQPDRNIVVLGDFNATIDDDSLQTYINSGMHDIFHDRTGSQIITHASNRRIDFILANDAVMHEIKPDTAFVFGTTAAPQDIDWKTAHQLPGYASDHFPVAVDLSPADQPTNN